MEELHVPDPALVPFEDEDELDWLLFDAFMREDELMSAACAMDPFQFAAFNDEEEDGEEQVDDEDEESNEPPAVEEQEDNEVTYRLKGLIEVPEPYQLPERTDAAFVPDVRVFEPVKEGYVGVVCGLKPEAPTTVLCSPCLMERDEVGLFAVHTLSSTIVRAINQSNGLVTEIPLPHCVRQFSKVSDENALFCYGQHVGMVTCQDGGAQMRLHSGMWRESQWAELRDLKVNPHQTSLFAYAAGTNLSVIDFGERLESLSVAECTEYHDPRAVESIASDFVSSLQWANSSCLSYTTDSGGFGWYDRRQKPETAVLETDCVTGAVYAHAYLSENTVILGGRNGLLQIVDIRNITSTRTNPAMLSIFEDIHMQDIGDIIPVRDGVLCFGSGTFTAWRIQAGGFAVAHQCNGAGDIGNRWNCHRYPIHTFGCLKQDEEVLACYSNGDIRTYTREALGFRV